MAMFDPVYVTEVINDILSRRGLQLTMIPKSTAEPEKQREASGKPPAAKKRKNNQNALNGEDSTTQG